MKKLNLEIPKPQAWYIDSTAIPEDGDIRGNLQHVVPDWVSPEYLASIGVEQWKLDGNEKNAELERVCKERSYSSRDQIVCGQQCPDYQEKVANFRKEHLHMDEEIRYILDGRGFFDVRDHNDKWIRILVRKGDLVVLPEGIYHRFTTDDTNYIHAMRLFKDEPKWTPYNRPCDLNESRLKYINTFLKKYQQETTTA